METVKHSKIEQEPVTAVNLGKGFHLYERRNEWVNWDGNTDVVSRSGRNVRLSLSDAEQHAEKWRIQGTKFVIDELPILSLQTKSGVMIVAEIFSDRPLLNYVKQAVSLQDCLSVGTLVKVLPPSKWGIAFPVEGAPYVSPVDGNYYSRTSSPGKAKSHLGWALKPRTIDDTAMKKLADDIASVLSHAKEHNDNE